jgi:hypothetical protein
MCNARRRDRDRGAVGHVLEDREVVDRQVPEHIDVRLDDTEVDPHRVEVAKITKVSLEHEVAKLLHSTRVDECVVDGEHDAPIGRTGNQVV